MVDDDRKEACLNFFKNLQGKTKKNMVGFEESLTILQDEAATRGLENSDIKIIVKIIKTNEIRAGLCVPLVKCLIPKNKISVELVEDIIIFWLAKCSDLAITVSTIILQWLTGLWEYQLVDRQAINSYYDCFFYNMLKRDRLESPIAKLIYLLTKPEDVTRRQVQRLLKLQGEYSKPPKHISALLSLFKSYKPELVPERIPSLNIESVWKPIPEVLRMGFVDAKTRGTNTRSVELKCFDWNTIKSDSRKKSEPLLPSIRYFQMGSSIYKDKDTKHLFDLNNVEDMGKYYFNVELPSNATSLLVNTAGYHFLTFASDEYQSRFSHNLYNALRRAFIIESGRFSYDQKKQLLEMTTEFCRYMQQGIPVVGRFLQEYLPLDTGELRPQILALMEWSTLVSVADLQDIALYLETIFLESSLEEKCDIIHTLGILTTNLFVNQRFGRRGELPPSPFLGLKPTSELGDIIPTIMKIAEHLITKGLNIHNYHTLLLAEALSFYETINKLTLRCNPPLLIIAPPAIIYGSLVSKSCSILSRVCALLLTYRQISRQLKDMSLRVNYEAEVQVLYVYVQDFGNALWYDRLFSDRYRARFLRSLPDKMTDHLLSTGDKLLNIKNHVAILPYKCTLSGTGLEINTKLAALSLADNYFPAVSEFIRALFEMNASQ